MLDKRDVKELETVATFFFSSQNILFVQSAMKLLEYLITSKIYTDSNYDWLSTFCSRWLNGSPFEQSRMIEFLNCLPSKIVYII